VRHEIAMERVVAMTNQLSLRRSLPSNLGATGSDIADCRLTTTQP
jgi:hypothetical protein